MKSIILKITKCATLIGIAVVGNQAFGYELKKECKASKPFQFVSGSCNSNDLLEGQAVARARYHNYGDELKFSGIFKNGVPHGKTYISGFNVQCIMNFNNGIPENNSKLSCEFPQSRSGITITPTIGNIDWETDAYTDSSGDERNKIKITLNLPEVETLGRGFYFGKFDEHNVKFKGTATSSTLSNSDALKISEAKGRLTFSNGATLDGSFNISCGSPSTTCEISHHVFNGVADALDKKYLYTYSYLENGQSFSYDLVFADGNKVKYYKDPNGLTFDATMCQIGCISCFYCGAKLLRFNQSKKLDIHPFGGKITTPDGRTYKGTFENGQPAKNGAW